MPKVEDILKTAKAEVGITEYPPNSNNVKYNTEYYGHPVQDGLPKASDRYPWCCVFVWWVFKHQSKFILKKTASCINLGQWFKDNGRWIEPGKQKPGDIVFFKFPTNNRWTNHVGIVDEVLGPNDIYDWEGNTSAKSDDNGGAVMRRRRTSNIVGYGRPNYDVAIKPVNKSYTKGVDLSSCQTSVDFNKLKNAGYKFVILRSTTKNGLPDSKFEKYWAGATNAGLHIAGVYKLSYALTIQQAQQEALEVIKLLKGRKTDIWLDVEKYGGQHVYGKEFVAQIITAFLTTCVKAGYDVGIYCDLNYYKNYITDDIKKICRFWIARYGKNTGELDMSYKPNVGEVMWQYTSHGQVDGIKSAPDNYVDLDIR